jgi:D-alanyl-D-alanine carboxypeptidase
MKRCFAVLFVAAIASAAFAQEEEGTGAAKGAQVNTTGKGYTAAYVIDAASRRVLFEENAHVPLPTASMAKMMTCIIAMERIQSGEIKLDTPVMTSARASKMGGSQIFAREGQTFPMQTLLAATMIRSANDAAEMIAEKLGGSAESFADLMNDKARQLGLKETTFYDPHGLPNETHRRFQRARPGCDGAGVDEVPADARVREDSLDSFHERDLHLGIDEPQSHDQPEESRLLR